MSIPISYANLILGYDGKAHVEDNRNISYRDIPQQIVGACDTWFCELSLAGKIVAFLIEAIQFIVRDAADEESVLRALLEIEELKDIFSDDTRGIFNIPSVKDKDAADERFFKLFKGNK